MRIIGVDFTSRPSRRKPITVQTAELTGERLCLREASALTDFATFEDLLRQPGPWVAAIDCPFGQPRRFLENAGWPLRWADCTAYVASLERQAFRDALDAYRSGRAVGDREHRRAVDRFAGGISPQKLYGVPVGLMYFESVPRLLRSGAHLPAHGVAGDAGRVVVEGYPGILARSLIGRRSYKTDTVANRTADQHAARLAILAALEGPAFEARYGFTVRTTPHLADDPSADTLDALLCAVQAAWASTKRTETYGIPAAADPVEGWISDPLVEAAYREAEAAPAVR